MTVTVSTPQPDRKELQAVFKDPRLLRAIEALFRDLREVLPTDIDAVDAKAQQALDDADAAMIAANDAQADADYALTLIAGLTTGVLVYMQETEPPPTSIWFKTDGTGRVIDIMQVT